MLQQRLLAGWLVGWLADWLDGWQAGWQTKAGAVTQLMAAVMRLLYGPFFTELYMQTVNSLCGC